MLRAAKVYLAAYGSGGPPDGGRYPPWGSGAGSGARQRTGGRSAGSLFGGGATARPIPFGSSTSPSAQGGFLSSSLPTGWDNHPAGTTPAKSSFLAARASGPGGGSSPMHASQSDPALSATSTAANAQRRSVHFGAQPSAGARSGPGANSWIAHAEHAVQSANTGGGYSNDEAEADGARAYDAAIRKYYPDVKPRGWKRFNFPSANGEEGSADGGDDAGTARGGASSSSAAAVDTRADEEEEEEEEAFSSEMEKCARRCHTRTISPRSANAYKCHGDECKAKKAKTSPRGPGVAAAAVRVPALDAEGSNDRSAAANRAAHFAKNAAKAAYQWSYQCVDSLPPACDGRYCGVTQLQFRSAMSTRSLTAVEIKMVFRGMYSSLSREDGIRKRAKQTVFRDLLRHVWALCTASTGRDGTDRWSLTK